MSFKPMQALLAACLFFAATALGAEGNAPKYIFYMIGDGMGVGQRGVAARYRQGLDGKEAKLVMNSFPVTGSTTTSMARKGVTDSAAAGTALACGVKTTSGTVGMDPAGKHLRSIGFDASEAGMKVGVVTTVTLDHATPAAFYASQPKRKQYYEIACQLAESSFDFFAGEPFSGKKKAKGRPLPTDLARQSGYTILTDKEGLQAAIPKNKKILWQTKVGFSIGRRKGGVSLPLMVQKAIEHLENEKGFFLMVEGGRIDWACHGNDLVSATQEVIDFDNAVAMAFEFYKKHPNETLILVTADHETGDLKLDPDQLSSPAAFTAMIEKQQRSTHSITEMVLDWKENSTTLADALASVTNAFGLTDLSPREQAQLTDVVSRSLGLKEGPVPKELKHLYGSRNPVVALAQTLRDKRCGVSWSGAGHTGASVPTTAVGVGAENFRGATDNTTLALSLRKLIKDHLSTNQ